MRSHRHLLRRYWPPLGGLGALVVFLTAAAATGSLGEVADLFRDGRYQEARQTLDAEEPSDAATLWQQRLTTDPDRAIELALDQARDRDLPREQRLQAALDGASVALARQQPQAAWQILQPLIEIAVEPLPGEAYLLAGRALRQAGQRQRAREMLAAVKPDDPAFAAARALLGRIGLESGDHELALRYFESAERHANGDLRPELLSGRWQALRLLGRDVEAREVGRRLLETQPTSLAAMELGELLRREDDELSALTDTLDTAAPGMLTPISPGRYTVQLAAFRDRALALQFIARWRVDIPDLRVVREVDELGQPLYRIQTGSFVSHAQASAEVGRIERAHGLSGFVAGSGE